jgi:rRNA-processing protein FCF1
VILDGNFIFTAIKYKLDIRDRLEKLLQGGEIKVFILKSALKELKSVGEKAKSATDFANTYCEIIDDDTVSGELPSDRLKAYIGKIPGLPTTS